MYTAVKTQQGEVRGSVADGVHTFKGLPYAASPETPAVEATRPREQ
jgi:carboxylesterase type B